MLVLCYLDFLGLRVLIEFVEIFLMDINVFFVSVYIKVCKKINWYVLRYDMKMLRWGKKLVVFLI